jgi:hypothetical protein
VIGAARLDAATYEEVEHDLTATGQALWVVAFAGVAAGMARLGDLSILSVVAAALTAMLAWAIWAFLTLVIGTRILPESETQADVGQLLRVLGFAAAPGMLEVLAIVPSLRPFVFAVSELWMLAAMVVAVRQALDYSSTLRAVAVCAIGWVVQMLVAVTVLGMLVVLPSGTAVVQRRDASDVPAAESVGVVRPSGVTPPVD